MKKKRMLPAPLCMLLAAVMLLQATGCSTKVQAVDLMDGITAAAVGGRETDAAFSANMARFSVDLFQKTADKDKNSLISPVSVMLALAMTANGADTETRAQMEALLGGELPLDTLNEYLYTYVRNLPSEKKSKLHIANSIWFRDDSSRLQVEKNFLQKNADYYQAAIYKAAFDDKTCDDINNWVKAHTDGMIEEMLDALPQEAVMYLINALVFDAEWEKIYNKHAVYDGSFRAADGRQQAARMMSSEEQLYLDDGRATGFLKPYKGGRYSFAALLPNEGTSIEAYMADLTGDGLLQTLQNAQNTKVTAVLPKFSYECEIMMNDALKALGMPLAFDEGADFSKLGKSSNGNIYISRVLHKTFIAVDEKGTKAGAATVVEVADESAGNYVALDRPFVYAIVDNATGLPIFLGSVMSMAE